ncbi:MAG: enoyl-CoA hydratase-related protein [Bacillota bacterium]
MNFSAISFTRENSAGWITLNRPKRFNALDIAMCEELIKALEVCAADRRVRAVVITGAGKAFCSGGDVKYFSEFLKTDPSEPVRQATKLLNRLIIDIRLMPKPVLAVINGAAVGAGMSLALSCDLRIASRTAVFKQAYTSIGLVPDGAWSLLVSLFAGFGKASEMIFLDHVIDSNQALKIGLVNEVVEPEKLMDTAREWAAKLVNGPTLSFAQAKNELNHAMLNLLERQLELERQSIIMATQTEDYKEGLAAFLAKRTPVFTGK